MSRDHPSYLLWLEGDEGRHINGILWYIFLSQKHSMQTLLSICTISCDTSAACLNESGNMYSDWQTKPIIFCAVFIIDLVAVAASYWCWWRGW